jgi:uncharacterized protein
LNCYFIFVKIRIIDILRFCDYIVAMNLKELGNKLEETNVWKEGFIVNFFNFLPIILILILVLSIWIYLKQTKSLGKSIVIVISFLLSFSLLINIWGYNFERFWLQVNNREISIGFNAKLAIFSDIHIGRFKDKTWVNTVINEINKIDNLDAIVVPGDLTYWPTNLTKESFVNDFAALKYSRYPIYVVLGNHDIEKPGPKLRAELELALTELGVNIIDNKTVDFKKWRLVGIEDIWSNKFEGAQSDLFDVTKPSIALTHQPDIVRQYGQLTTKPVLTLT